MGTTFFLAKGGLALLCPWLIHFIEMHRGILKKPQLVVSHLPCEAGVSAPVAMGKSGAGELAACAEPIGKAGTCCRGPAITHRAAAQQAEKTVLQYFSLSWISNLNIEFRPFVDPESAIAFPVKKILL